MNNDFNNYNNNSGNNNVNNNVNNGFNNPNSNVSNNVSNNYNNFNNNINTANTNANNNRISSNEKVYYYGNDAALEKYKSSKAEPDKKKFHFHIFGLIILLFSVYAFMRNLKFDFIALGMSGFCFIFSVCNFKTRSIFYYLAFIVSLASIVMFGLFYFGILDNDSEALLTIKKDHFTTDVQNAATKVQEDYRILSYSDRKCYNFDTINTLFTSKLKRSPFGGKYSSSSYIIIDGDLNNKNSIICFVDEKGNGYNNINNADLNKNNMKIGNAKECVLPSYCK